MNHFDGNTQYVDTLFISNDLPTDSEHFNIFLHRKRLFTIIFN